MSKRSDSMKIMQALSDVDEDLLSRSESWKGEADRRKRNANRLWISLGSCAAAICFAAAGVAGWQGIQISEEARINQELFSPEPMPMALADEGGDELQERPNEQIFPGEGQEGEASDRMKQGVDALAQREQERDEERRVDLANMETENMVQGGTADDLDSAEIMIDDGSYDKEISSSPLHTAEELTEEQARQVEVLGTYVPTVPMGYAFQEARLHQKGGEHSLSISWAKGMDYIMISIGIVDEEETAVVDVSRPECYDQRLYEIPYSYTVPEEYRKTVDHPIFAAEDLSLDIVKSRVLNRGEDRGDTDTPRGDFYVLYPGGVQVRFNGKATPEQVWEMLSPLSELTAPAP